MLTIKRLSEYLLYDADSGDLFWIKDKGIAKKGSIVGGKSNQLYLEVHLDGKKYLVHRLAWFYEYGYWPKIIDHIDGDTRNNRIVNLREVTTSQNALNKRKSKSNRCGHKNVSFKRDRNKYVVNLEVNGRMIHIGHYADLELAELVAIESRNKYHGEFARHE
jgi:hypothetical protein